MTMSPLAGKPAPEEMLVDLARLEREYYAHKPDVANPAERVSFGTSGHLGSSLHGSFTEAHILAITQAICDYRRSLCLWLRKDRTSESGVLCHVHRPPAGPHHAATSHPPTDAC